MSAMAVSTGWQIAAIDPDGENQYRGYGLVATPQDVFDIARLPAWVLGKSHL